MKQQINLLPPEYRAQQTINWRQFLPYAASAFLLLLLIGSSMFLYLENMKLENEFQKLKSEKAVLEPKQKQLQNDQEAIEELQEKVASLEKLSTNNVSLYYLLKEITAILPPNVWLNQVAGDNAKIQINGSSINIADIGLLIVELNKLPSLKEVVLVQAEKTESKSQTITVFELLGYYK